MKKLCVLIGTLATACGMGAAAQTYNDVLVIVNSNSPMSQNVASYFRSQRSIPSVNICSIAMPTTEEIDSATYAGILAEIKNYMQAYGLTSSINYIVTTQGVPLKVRRSGGVFGISSNSGSFDSDLCLLNSQLESQIGNAGVVSNPYVYSTARFSRSTTFNNIVLVTRLAGYTYNDIVGLINRACQPYYSTGEFVFDVDITKGTHILNTRMNTARNILKMRGYNVYFDSSSVFVTNRTSVLGYVSWGSNDANWASYTQKAQPHFTWSPKALAETYVSSSGRTFEDSTFVEPTIGWQSLVADLIHEGGVTGVKGYVWEPYTSALAQVHYLFDRWTSSTGYNLAESFYASSAYLSWMDVVIGDPKATFAGEGHLPVELTVFGGMLRNGSIELHWKTATESNNYGFEVQKLKDGSWSSIAFVAGSGTSNTPRTYTASDADVLPRNIYRLKQIDRDGSASYSYTIEVAGIPVESFRLGQNYPNPFRADRTGTTIPFDLTTAATVSIEIYTVDGSLVARPIRNEHREQGSHAIVWRGTDDHGSPLPPGRYIYHLRASKADGTPFTDSKVVSLLR
ncbi:MAG: TIGR03790 family protein [Bacteroidota bacterium]|nr:TIGR03790 family protein [Bacteroidota bacterium]